MSLRPKVLLPFIVMCVSFAAKAQDTLFAAGKVAGLPNGFFSSIDSKTTTLENKLTPLLPWKAAFRQWVMKYPLI